MLKSINDQFQCGCSRGQCNADAEMDKMFKFLASKENDSVRPKTLTIRGRNVTFAKTCGQVADCTFAELCDRVSYQIAAFKLRFLYLISNLVLCFSLSELQTI